MKTYFDILQVLKNYNIYIHVGKRLWDIEMAGLEVDNLHKAGLLSDKDYATMKVILTHEHHIESKREVI